MQDPWKDFNKEPFSPEDHQRIRWLMARLEERVAALWRLWGWLATAVSDRKAWASAGAVGVAVILWSGKFSEFVRAVMGAGQ